MLGQERFSKKFQQFAMTVLVTAFFWGTAIGLSDKRLCADEHCKKIISHGKAQIRYQAGEVGMVSFMPNSNIRIMSKSAGKDPSLWGVVVNGREGYAPKSFIIEDKIFVKEKDLKYLVDVVLPGTKIQEISSPPVIKGSENVIEPTTTVPFEKANPSDIIVNRSKEIENKEEIPADPSEIVNSTKEIESKEEIPASVIGDIKVTGDSNTLNVQKVTEDSTKNDGIWNNSVDAINKDVPPTASPVPTVQPLDSTTNDGGILNNSVDAINKELTSTASPVQTENPEIGTNKLPEDNDRVAVNGTGIQQKQHEIESVNNDENHKDEEAAKDDLNSGEIENVMDSPLKQSMDNNEETNYRNNEQTNSSLNNSSVGENQNYSSTLINNPQPSTPSMSEEETAKAHYSNEHTHTQEAQKSPHSLLYITSKSSSETTNILVNSGSTEETERKSTKEIAQKETSYSSTTQITSHLDPNEIDKANANEKHLASSTVEETIIKNDLSSQPSVPDNETNIYPVNDVAAQNADSLPIPTEKNDINSNKPSDNPISDTKEESSNAVIDVIVKPSQETVRTPINNLSAEETLNERPSTVGGETGAQPNEIDGDKANETYLTTSTVEEDIVEKAQSFQQSLPDYKTSSNHVNDVTQNAGSPPIPAEQNDINSNQPSDNMISDTNRVEEETIKKITTDFVSNEPNTTQQVADKTKETEVERQELITSEKAFHDGPPQIGIQAQLNNPEHHQSNENQKSLQDHTQFSNLPSTTTTTTHLLNSNYEDSFLQTTDKPNSINNDQFPIENDSFNLKKATISTNSLQESTSEHSLVDPIEPEDNLQKLTSPAPPIIEHQELDKKENRGVFATIMETVNNMLPNNKKHKNGDYDNNDGDSYNELDRILFLNSESAPAKDEADEKLFCEKLDQNNCPASKNTPLSNEMCECSWKTLFINKFTLESFLQALASKILEISELIAFLAIVACTSLFFIFGYYCFCKSSSEGALLSKLNQLESSLLASHKENAILKQNLLCTRQKLSSIEDNSFGTNDMVVSLKKELEEELLEKARLQEQIVTLQKELENAADAGIELNKIVSELLSNQTGDESIISSVEELQKQLNEQQNTILEINASLAEKSRENSELQLMIAEQNSRYETQLSDLQQDNDELEAEKSNLRSRLEEIRADFDKDITAALESKNFEIKRLQNEIVELNDKVEAEHAKWQTCMAKIEALEECLKSVKRGPNVNISQLIDVANIKADLLDTQKKYNVLKDRMELELDARKLAESQLQSSTAEIEKIKQDFNQTEKDKLEAQTRLEVLSNYFKEKENQLQKELSLKETMRLKQQGETTTTVDRLTTMQEEIQSLKSQNDALRAEIEAQVAAHKAQTGTLENRAHETWLAARQLDRRFEEARAEATALRRKLTALAGGNVNEIHKNSAGPAGIGEDLANAPSPILMETTGSPILGRMPPPPFLPPPFMGPPPPFMGMPPPPPFVPPGEIRPAPLGRILSPPPQRSGHLDFDDYLDYEGSGPWHRHHTYSPPPRTYRSLSPTDSRYNYGNERDLISTYDTETDFSPPPSPRGSRRRGGGSGSEKEDYKFRHPYNNTNKSLPDNKDPISSGSDNSSFQAGKTLKSSGGKFLI